MYTILYFGFIIFVCAIEVSVFLFFRRYILFKCIAVFNSSFYVHTYTCFLF